MSSTTLKEPLLGSTPQFEMKLVCIETDMFKSRQARLSTLDQDLKLEGSQFGSAVSILSAG